MCRLHSYLYGISPHTHTLTPVQTSDNALLDLCVVCLENSAIVLHDASFVDARSLALHTLKKTSQTSPHLTPLRSTGTLDPEALDSRLKVLGQGKEL